MNFFRKVLLVNVTALMSFVIRLVQTIILTRWLGPTGIGQYAVVCAAVMLGSQISALGFPVAFLYYSQHDPKQTSVYQIHSIWSGLILGLFGGGILGALVMWRPSYFGQVPGYAIWAVSLYAVCMILAGVGRNSLLRRLESKRLGAMTIASSLGSLALIGALAWVGQLTVASALVCLTGMQMIRLAVAWIWVAPTVDWHIKPRVEVLIKLGKMGLRQGGVDIMVLLNSTVNIMILKMMISDFEQIGFFSRGMQIAMLVVTASQAVLPVLFSRWASSPESQLTEHFEKVFRVVTTFSLLVIISILLLAKPLVIMLFGRAFIPAVTPMMILLPGTMLYLLGRVVIQFLGSRGLPEVSCVVLLISCAINALLSWLLIPKLGIHGAAMASSVSHVVLLGMLLCVMVIKFKVRIMRCVWLSLRDCRSMTRQLGVAQ
ncbi:MAG: oligosaccharide flippase family protein [Phycisphaeraceae bacterium]|nr:oligosaccharide flippase family protein [Phycisphaeraceae bacterium]